MLGEDEMNRQLYDFTIVEAMVGTGVKVIQSKLIWTIRDFRESVSSSQFIDAPTIRTGQLKRIKLSLKPNVKIDGEDYIEIEYKPNKKPNLLKICLLTRNEEERLSVTLHDEDTMFLSRKYFKQSDILTESENPYIGDDGKLRLLLTVMTGSSIVSENKKNARYKALVSNSEVFSELLFNRKDFSDVVFRVEGMDIYAQKAVLVRSSPVFAAMFSNDTLENLTNSVNIVDCTYESMYLLLEYIYKAVIDKFYNLSYETCLDVMVIAEKYNVDCLKVDLEDIVYCKLNNDNVIECLVVADSIGASCLKERVLNYIARYTKNIIELPGYPELSNSHPDLSNEIVTSLAPKNKKRKKNSVVEHVVLSSD